MTYGKTLRDIKRKSLIKEINNLRSEVKAILNNDPDASNEDKEIKAYKQLIAEKEKELEYL